MSNDRIREILEKIPFTPIFFICIAYLGWDYYDFARGAASPLREKESQFESAKVENAKLQDKIKKADEFLRSLEKRKVEIRGLIAKLDEMKNTLSSEFDSASFMKSVDVEAKLAGLKIERFSPLNKKDHEYYAEQTFDLQVKGLYPQLVSFLERVSNLERIIRIDDFRLAATSSSFVAYPEISASLQLKGFKYLGSKADDILKDDAPKAPASTSPATEAPKPSEDKSK